MNEGQAIPASSNNRTRYITPEECLNELNRLVDYHNDTAADFLRCLALLGWRLAIALKKAEQFDALLEEHNRLLALAQRAEALQNENEHLWHVIADLDAALRSRETYDEAEKMDEQRI